MAGEKSGSFVELIRKALNDAASGGGGGLPDELLFVPKDGKKLGRFLSEFDKPTAVIMHDKWQALMPQPCLKQYGEPCQFHGSDFRTTTWYAWTVWDYEAKAKRVGVWKASLQSPVERLLDIFDMNGTIKDRDIELSRVGQGTKSRYKARPTTPGPTPFEGPVDMPYSDEKVLEILKGMVSKLTLDDVEKKDE